MRALETRVVLGLAGAGTVEAVEVGEIDDILPRQRLALQKCRVRESTCVP